MKHLESILLLFLLAIFSNCKKEKINKNQYQTGFQSSSAYSTPNDVAITNIANIPASFLLNVSNNFIYNQKEKANCVATSAALVSSFYNNKLMSEDYVYHYLKKNKGGCSIATTFDDLNEIITSKGICTKDLFTSDDCDIEPSQIARNKALEYRASSFRNLAYDANKFKQILLHGIPIIVGIYIDDDFFNLSSNVIDDVKTKDLKHALVIIGYNEEGFILRNSWGNNWNNDAQCTLTYNYLRKNIIETCLFFCNNESNLYSNTIIQHSTGSAISNTNNVFIDVRDGKTYSKRFLPFLNKTILLQDNRYAHENSNSVWGDNLVQASIIGNKYYYDNIEAQNACPYGYHPINKSEWEAIINNVSVSKMKQDIELGGFGFNTNGYLQNNNLSESFNIYYGTGSSISPNESYVFSINQANHASLIITNNTIKTCLRCIEN